MRLFHWKKPFNLALIALIAVSLQMVVSIEAANAKAYKKLEYTCNEGIPLIVEFINTKKSNIAIISHDSFPPIPLDSVVSGSDAKYSNGNWVLHVKGNTALVGTHGKTDDTCRQITKSGKNHHSPEAITSPRSFPRSFPRKAKSWGGIVRSGPGMHFRKKASLKEGEWIMLLERTDQIKDDYPWFKVEYRGRVGYKWGGILCSVGEQVAGTFQTCN